MAASVVIIKIGTSSICDEASLQPRLAGLARLVETVAALRARGLAVLIVSSGAVAVGRRRLAGIKRPKHLAQLQAVAAVGQGRLMALYDTLFSQYDIPIAQILLTRDNLSERTQYLNARQTLRELISFKVVPIINENDSVSNAEIRFGDNDSLSAITAGMINADYLFLLTDVDALYTDNPRVNPLAKPIRIVDHVRALKEKVTVSSPGSALGTGGMVTKLIAAELATSAGCAMFITLGSRPDGILEFLDEVQAHQDKYKTHENGSDINTGGDGSGDGGDADHMAEVSPPTHGSTSKHGTTPQFEPTFGTLFIPQPNRMVDRKWWILHSLAPSGALWIDAGAVRAITQQKSSLFAAGIKRVDGLFNAQECVRIMTEEVHVDTPNASCGTHGDGSYAHSGSGDGAHGAPQRPRGIEVARGLVNYQSAEIQRILGARSAQISDLLGYIDTPYVVHRDNIAVVGHHDETATTSLGP